jgi:drug/metabolite transporter (DMT)-like permease
LGAATLLAWARYKKIALPKSRKIWLHLWVVSLLLNVIPGVFFALAETEVTSILAGIINAVTPLMTLLAIALVTRDEKPKFYQVLGILIGFIGVLTVLGVWKGLGENPLWAIFVLLAAVTCYGLSCLIQFNQNQWQQLKLQLVHSRSYPSFYTMEFRKRLIYLDRSLQ